jgi:hypothetical protein
MQRLFRRGGILFLLVAAGVQIGCMAQSPPPAPDHSEEGFVALFNGEDLTGWEGDFNLWKVEDGMLVGRSPGIEHNNFLATGAIYENFILKFSFHLVNGEGNSGVQFRSRRVPNSHEVSGYQADIGEEYWGSLYDESRRNRVLVDAREAGVEKVLNKKDWNDYVVRCEGDHVVLELNGLKTVDYRETDSAIPRSGIIAVQIHSGGPMEVQFRNIRLKELAR